MKKIIVKTFMAYAVFLALTVSATILLAMGFIAQINNDVVAKTIIGEIAGIINIVAYIPYVISIIKRETRPSIVTWWIWAALEVMLSVSYIMSGAESTKWLPIASFFGMFLVAILSLKYGKKSWTTIDATCLAGAILGIMVWIFFGNPVVALAVFLIVDMLAIIPTIVKSWDDPYGEDLFAWIITFLSGAFNIFAIERWTSSIAMLPLYNFFIYLTVVWTLFYFKREQKTFTVGNKESLLIEEQSVGF